MQTNKKGFTLIELLVVISIIGVLSTLAVVSLGNARLKARDAKRMSDARTLQTAIELYMNSSATGNAPGVPANWAALGTDLANNLKSGTPADPSTPGNKWCYCSDTVDATKYLIAVATEEIKAIPGDLDGAASTFSSSYGTRCMCNDNAAPASNINCDDSAAGNVDGGTVTAFCLGSL